MAHRTKKGKAILLYQAPPCLIHRDTSKSFDLCEDYVIITDHDIASAVALQVIVDKTKEAIALIELRTKREVTSVPWITVSLRDFEEHCLYIVAKSTFARVLAAQGEPARPSLVERGFIERRTNEQGETQYQLVTPRLNAAILALIEHDEGKQ